MNFTLSFVAPCNATNQQHRTPPWRGFSTLRFSNHSELFVKLWRSFPTTLDRSEVSRTESMIFARRQNIFMSTWCSLLSGTDAAHGRLHICSSVDFNFLYLTKRIPFFFFTLFTFHAGHKKKSFRKSYARCLKLVPDIGRIERAAPFIRACKTHPLVTLPAFAFLPFLT